MGLFRLRLDFLPFLVQRRMRLVDDQPVTGDQSLTVARMRQLADEFEVGESEFLDSRETRDITTGLRRFQIEYRHVDTGPAIRED